MVIRVHVIEHRATHHPHLEHGRQQYHTSMQAYCIPSAEAMEILLSSTKRSILKYNICITDHIDELMQYYCLSTGDSIIQH